MGNSSAHRKAQILLTFFLGIIFSFRVACSLFNWHRFRHTYTFRQSCVHIVSFVLPFGTMQFMRRISRKIEVSAVWLGANGLPRICRAIQSHTKYVIIAAVVGAFATRAIFSLFLPLPLRAMCVCCVDSVLVVHAVSEFLCQTCIRIHPFSISLQILFFVWLIFRFSVFCCESSARTNWSIACCFMLSHKVVNKQHKRNCAFSIGLR